MNPVGRGILVVGVLVGLAGCGLQLQETPASDSDDQAAQSKTFEKVRGPAVAGMFYKRHPKDLTQQVDGYLAKVKPEPIKNLRGLVCPHAGYDYSGLTAAHGYKLLVGRDVRTVIVMAPTHTAHFEGASIPDVDAYETPLGMVPLSPKAAELGKLAPFVVNPPCDVTRPPRWQQAPKQLPAFGEETPHSWEHSLEVQLPFLQRTLKDFSLVPIVFGRVDPEAAARTLIKYLDEKTLLVASSDLSHYLPYETAKGLDTTCCKAICSLNTEWMAGQQACGERPILTLMHIARQKGWKATLLDYRNSGDTAGDKSGVVGYAAIAFHDPAGAASAVEPGERIGQSKLTADQRKSLLELARKTVTEIVTRRKPPEVDAAGMAGALSEPGACFVTLNKNGRLRGCIGSIFPERPLYQAIISSAASAAIRDRRFSPVRSDELDQIEIEISLLSLPERLEFNSPDELLKKLRPHVDGVVLRVGEKKSIYLPQVWKQIPDKEQFLNHLAEKAGLDQSDWRSPEARILVYQVEAFDESEM